MTLSEQCQELKALKAERDEAGRQHDELKERYKIAQRALLDRMEEEDSEGHKTDGTNFVPTETVYGQIQDRSEFIKWAQENNPELLEPRERKELINQEVRRIIADGGEWPPGLGFYVREYVSQQAA